MNVKSSLARLVATLMSEPRLALVMAALAWSVPFVAHCKTSPSQTDATERVPPRFQLTNLGLIPPRPGQK